MCRNKAYLLPCMALLQVTQKTVEDVQRLASEAEQTAA